MKTAELIAFALFFLALLVRLAIAPAAASCWAPILGLVLLVALYYARAFIPGSPDKAAHLALKSEIENLKNDVQRLSMKVGLSRG